ncbi:WXG100 family type VII secretion target [Streptomyces nigrescens]|uniref:WXG100 family type VII secretion target n=1 Tax=Streptomyces sp. Isolate_219 TaxID=2950110 RepID=UPI0021C98319|nr:WXG100 family type VII secretion target [Streptomyces sp. Isolate_219]MCR8578877.1 WXG100 family type VII secretion target [Streptomyces sp. Isolate_219]
MSERRNPEALHEAAAGWREMGKHLDGLVRDLDRHVGTAAAANWHGPAGEAFAGEWHRLKRSVDDSLPAFELAAADLENAAAAPPEDKGGEEHHEAPPVKNSATTQSSSGPEVAYGFMALGQLANGLGGAFGKRGGGGGQSRGPVVRHTWETSTAAQGPDPFGPAKNGDAKTRGGEGIAKGARTQPAVAEPAPGEERTPKAGQDNKGTATKPAAAAATGGDAPAKGAPASGGEAPGQPAPDVTQHGAFG